MRFVVRVFLAHEREAGVVVDIFGLVGPGVEQRHAGRHRDRKERK